MNNESMLGVARFYWQLGRWEDLAAIESSIPGKGQICADDVQLALYKSQALFQLGRIVEARALLRALDAAGADRGAIMSSLWSGAQNSLARGLMLSGRKPEGEALIRAAVEAGGEGGDLAAVAETRAAAEWAAMRQAARAASAFSATQRKLFIDCGGFDGCSAIKFLLSFPEFDAITFEPNPELWRYYEGLPTQLVKKAVHTFDGAVSFRIDAVDGDGSSLIESKNVDFSRQMSNEESPLITVPCIDLSAFIAAQAVEYDRIVLKLDVEGAEYGILEKMLDEGTLSLVDQLYCEFHHNKIDIPLEHHRDILARARAVTRVEPWDSVYSVFNLAPNETAERVAMRERIVKDILRAKKKMKGLSW